MIPKTVTSIQKLPYPMASNRLRQDMLPTSNAEHGKPNKEESQSHPHSYYSLKNESQSHESIYKSGPNKKYWVLF